MQNEKKYFLSPDSMLDSDSADFAVSPNAWVNAENVRTGSTDAGVIGTVESVGSTLLLSSPAPGQNYIAIGSAEDVENSRFVTFYYDTMGLNDKIECFYTDTNTTYVALYSSQVTRGLNFSKNSVIHSAKITNNLLSWVDGTNNEPRKINLESAIKANNAGFVTTAQPYTFPLAFSEITMIKPPPSYTPNIIKEIDVTFINNFIATQSFEFSYQYVYYDYEITVPGAYSQGSRLNFPDNTFNKIVVTMDNAERIPSTVRIVNLVARISNGTQEGGNNAFVVKTWNKENAEELIEINNQNNGTQLLTYNFYNDISGQYLASDDVLRPFDNVPVYSQTHEVAKNRYFLGNNTEGYDVPNTSSLLCSLPNSINLNSANNYVNLYSLVITTPCFYSTKWVFSGWLIWTTITVGNTRQTGYFEITTSSQFQDGFCNPPPLLPAPTVIASTILIYRGVNASQVGESIRNYYGGVQRRYNSAWQYTNNIAQLVTIPGNAYNVFPQLSKYKMGIVFYDYAMRKCGVVNNTNEETRLVYTAEGQVSTSTDIHTLALVGTPSIVPNIVAGDIVVITESSTFNGTYNVIEADISGVTIVVSQTVTPSIPLEDCTIEVYRLFSNSITTGSRDFHYYYATPYINWELSNDNAVNEIPSWASYYSVVRTLNLRTRFLIQSCVPENKAKYATRNTDGTYNYANAAFTTGTVAIAIPTDALIQSGLGYVYTEGDICIIRQQFYEDTIQLPVIGQDQNYILVKAQDLNDIKKAFVYEIYTPYKASEQEPYYEIGEIYGINNAGAITREYSQITGILAPDSYVFNRNIGTFAYSVNAMCPNDLFYKRWDGDAGKSNFITKLGQAKAITTITWSDVIVSGTQVNGSSTFRLGSSTRVPDDCGSINKLQLTSKVQSEGTVMLSICTAETNSMYLGETQITDSTGGTQFFSASTNVISTINTLKGSFGTINPEGVVEFRGSVYYPDANRGVWVQYSSNGLFPISSYRMTRFWKLFFAQYTSMTVGEIEALGSRPYIFATMDASHMELVISIPKLLETPPKGYLPDYPEMVYPFDIWDGQGKTIVYNLETVILPQPHWQGSYSFNPEWFVSLSNKLYSLKDGRLYIHNQTDSYNNFYGTQYSSKIMVIANQLPTKPKTYNNVSVESNKVPDFVYFYNDYPYIQTSDLIATDFRDLEGVFYATLFRNKIIPTNSGFTTDGLLIGEYMRNVAMKVLFQFEAIDTPLELKYLNVGYTLSRGHTV